MIQSHPDAPEGVVKRLGTYKATDFPARSAVLCRNTAPLIGLAYSLLKRDVPARILGRDIGASLSNVVKKMRAGESLPLLVEKLRLWKDSELTAALSKGRDPERIEDQHACLTMFISNLDQDSQTVSDLLAKIDLMFEDKELPGRITLCTIHRAKGLEWPTVFILDPSLMPSKFATRPWQLIQERNLHYVAVTRAQDSLIYINSGNLID